MSDTAESLAQLAEAALEDGEEEAAETRLAAWLAANRPNPTALHWHALLLRALDRREEALAKLEQARALAQVDATIVHSLAQIALEAGRPAASLYLQAIRLAPARAELRLGLASARYAEGEGAMALGELDAMLAANPGWYDGHRQYAQLAAMTGDPGGALASTERALARFPDSGDLHLLTLELLLEAEDYAAALAATDRAVAGIGEAPELLLVRAAALDELGRHGGAADLFDRLGEAANPGHAIRRLRHLLRTGEPGRASQEAEPWLAGDDADLVWPYASLAWRLTGDERGNWLEGQPGLFDVIDLPADAVDLAALAKTLRALHARSGRFLNQSVRGGTQTDGPLLARSEPVIAQLREALRQAVADFIGRLPPPDSAHPLLGRRRMRKPRFAGSWSVRLTDSGFHSSHLHPEGWISSAFYVAVPDAMEGEEGWLALGESPADLGLDLPPLRMVEPKPGRLALFPSTMWHGTRPFSAGERMTVAFDIARP